ncbi:MAG: diguanylate cyclase, partial [Nitrospiraceae bacterium]
AILSSLLGSLSYYFSLRNSAMESAHEKAEEAVRDLKSAIETRLMKEHEPVRFLASLEEIRNALSGNMPDSQERAHALLDRFCETLSGDVCYVMDRDGNTILSSNRNDPDSFLDRNYSFRPYFQNAIAGNPTTYLALGVTSQKRGIYYSYPVRGDKSTVPSGVAVLKSSIKDIENELHKSYQGVMLLTDPRGVIFICSSPDLDYQLLWQLTPKHIEDIAASRQFGAGPWHWTGMKREGERTAVDHIGKKYEIHEKTLRIPPGWKILYLHDQEKVLGDLVNPLIRESGYVISSLCLLIASFVLYLYKKASGDIKLRERLRTESLTDSLTGCYNRRGFSTLIEHQIKVTRRKKRERFLVYVDLDNLKILNDTFGHSEGDRALKDVAHILSEASRESDIVARLGGDEFVVYYEGDSDISTPVIMGRLNELVSAHNQHRGPGMRLSISAGIAKFGPDHPGTLEEMLSHAENLMYAEKEKKRQEWP